jgi:hypothetical protein
MCRLILARIFYVRFHFFPIWLIHVPADSFLCQYDAFATAEGNYFFAFRTVRLE